MPKITEHKQGIASWFDLGTPDPEAAKAFYADLLGWTYQDNPMEVDGQPNTYSMAMVDGETAAAIFGQTQVMVDAAPGESHASVHWSVYFTVNDVEASTAKVSELGGTVIVEPFDVEPMPGMVVGRMSVLQDPGGAFASLWQPVSHIGSSIKMEEGAVHWVECLSGNRDATVKFYTELFGSTSMQMPGMENYMIMMVGEEASCGIMDMPDEVASKGAPPHWVLYFQVADVDAAIATAEKNGATIVNPAFDAPGIGRMGHIMDPQGAFLALTTPAAH